MLFANGLPPPNFPGSEIAVPNPVLILVVGVLVSLALMSVKIDTESQRVPWLPLLGVCFMVVSLVAGGWSVFYYRSTYNARFEAFRTEIASEIKQDASDPGSDSSQSVPKE